MLSQLLNHHHIILASGSPRRQQFFKDLNLNYTISVPNVKEVYPPSLQREEITNYLAQLKADAFTTLQKDDILVTSDTIVWHNNKAIGKPKSIDNAKTMLQSLSGSTHEVISSVCIRTISDEQIFHQITEVHFKELQKEEIDYYVDTYRPLDKAGSYGIQEWMGLIAITQIRGDYYNVMGLPVRLLYETLTKMVKK